MTIALPTPTPTPITENLRTRALTFLPMLGVGYTLAITKWPLHLPTTCGFKLLTGLPCPGCGMTHACCALANLHPIDALHYNLFVVPFAVGVLGTTALLAAELITNRKILGPIWKRVRKVFLWSSPAILLVAWVVNLFNLWPWT